MATATATKKTTSSVSLPKSVFDVEVNNHELIKLAYNAYLSAGHDNWAKSKTRGEVSGGGKKPWKQKGTGRARFGSTRNPIWRKGGVAFGPTGNENYLKKMSAAAKRTAIRQALTLAARNNEVLVISEIKTTGKTKEMVKFLSDNKLDGKKVVIAVETKTPELTRATNNLGDVKLVQATYLNVFSILNADKVVLVGDSVKLIEKWLGA